MLTLILAAHIASHETSEWCADRVVGENSRGRYAINYLWEAEEQTDGTVVCLPLDTCATADLTGDGRVGGPDFNLLIDCFGAEVDSLLPPSRETE